MSLREGVDRRRGVDRTGGSRATRGTRGAPILRGNDEGALGKAQKRGAWGEIPFSLSPWPTRSSAGGARHPISPLRYHFLLPLLLVPHHTLSSSLLLCSSPPLLYISLLSLRENSFFVPPPFLFLPLRKIISTRAWAAGASFWPLPTAWGLPASAGSEDLRFACFLQGACCLSLLS